MNILKRIRENVSSAQSVAFGTIFMMFFTLISKFLGFFREIIVAYLFGTSWRLDAVVVAVDSTSQLISLIIGGLSLMMITVYHGIKNESEERAKEYAFSIISSTSLIMIGFGLILFFFPDRVISIFAPGFGGEIFEYAVRKVRYLSVLPLISGAKLLLGSLLKAERRFFQFAFAQIIFNIVIIPSLLITSERFSEASYVLSWVMGEFSITLFYFILSRKFMRFSFKIFDGYVRRTFNLSFPIILSNGLYTVNQIVDKVFASQLPYGRISALRYAGIFINVISSVVIGNFLSATYTELSERVKAKDFDGAFLRLKRSASISMNISIPTTFWIILMVEPMIKLAFQRGNFTIESTHLVSTAMIAYSFIMMINPISSLLRQLIFTLEKVKVLFFIAAFSVITNAFFDWILMKPFGHAGIAASTSIVAFFNMILLIFFVRRIGFPSFIPWRKLIFDFLISLLSFIIFLYLSKILNFIIWMILGNTVFLILFVHINKEMIMRILKKI